MARMPCGGDTGPANSFMSHTNVNTVQSAAVTEQFVGWPLCLNGAWPLTGQVYTFVCILDFV
jgi:hypothetical protein